MGQSFVVLLIGIAFVPTSEALTFSNHVELSGLTTSRRSIPSNRALRAARTTDGAYEERGILGPETLMRLSTLAEKQKMHKLSKKLEHRSWLAAGESPQTLFKKNSWAGKTIEQLKEDPRYLRYEGLDDVWLKAQYKKGTLHPPDKWLQLVRDAKNK
ncbi:hypothetical protein AM587_10009956 [Phytophthora nicotianae]|uniref:RxLR effector protein n=1 Tax=Phytophthora nicotianae TaxID=4792 RepID=A0A0W8DWU9_PHYNI|nr:hypothetical protein AM587_10009956 [Phytophthora nicotianae]